MCYSGGAVQEHLLLLLFVDPCLMSDQLHPCLSLRLGAALKMEIPCGRVETEDIFTATPGIFEIGHRCEIGEGDLLVKTRLGGVLVDGEKVGAEDEEERFPLLQSICSQREAAAGCAREDVLLFCVSACVLLRS